MTPIRRSTLQASLAALALAGLGCAHGAAAPAADPASAPARMMVTGSRIPRVVDPDHPVPPTASPVRIYTREQLLATGRPDLSSAIGALDPSAP